MSASGRRTVIVSVAALAVAVVLVLAATTGPSDLVGERRADPATGETVQQPQDRDQAAEHVDETVGAEQNNDFVQWLRDLFWFVLLLFAIAVTVGMLRTVALRLVGALPDKQLVLDLDPLPDVHVARDALRRDLDAYDAALAGSDVRNGIVACWVLLEQTASGLGVVRRPAETATEFVVHFLHALDVDPRPVAALAALYQEARFSSHDLPPEARVRAEAALRGIEADLDRSAAT
jgi:hypothetical protein